jgi:hypothetical protein
MQYLQYVIRVSAPVDCAAFCRQGRTRGTKCAGAPLPAPVLPSAAPDRAAKPSTLAISLARLFRWQHVLVFGCGPPPAAIAGVTRSVL